ncbi:class F sortase [Microbacterium mangrovi]|uniref:class F sortase n=1 Tax=Microbacterium mangrovi TaxID=1348253 RepID=UPI00068F379D|nr:class F sortase [Microbacterium mangrovi]
MSTSTDPQRSNRGRVILIVLAGLAAIFIAIGVIGFVSQSSAPRGYTAKDMRGNTVQLDPGATPEPSASARPDDGGRLIVASVGLNVPLGSLSAVNGSIVPPGFTSAYWVRNVGVPLSAAKSGTVYVVMHALRNGGMGPGNYLTDIERQRSKVAEGAAVDVDGVKYTVTGSQLIRKNKIAQSASVWKNTPGRLVLITCLEHPDGSPSTDNLVVTAELASAPTPQTAR